MDFLPSEEEQALQEGIRSYCESRFPASELQRLEGAGGFDRDAWTELAELGVFQLRRPESEGGLGAGMAQSVLVFQELGAALVPGPLVWTQLAAGKLAAAADASVIYGGLDMTTANPEPVLIEHRDEIHELLVLRQEGVFRLESDRIECEPVTTPTDPLTPVHYARQLPTGEQFAGPDEAKRLRLEGMCLVGAQLLGIATATLEIALAHAKEREQFGRSIGSFQAIKHLLADMFARQELARASVYAAGATLDHPEVGDVEQAVCSAKIVCGEAAVKNARTCIQIHGGMGYTWEVPDHYFLKRSWVLETAFGAGEEHALRMADFVAVDSPEARDGE